MNHKKTRVASIRFPQKSGADASFFNVNRAKGSPPSMAVELTDSELANAHGGGGPNVQVLPYEGGHVYTTVPIVTVPGPFCTAADMCGAPPCEQCPGDYGDVWGGKSDAHQIIAVWTEITDWVVNIALAYVVPSILRAIQLQSVNNWVLRNANPAVNTISEVSEEAAEIEGEIEPFAELVLLVG
jgi:hypothetical protein